MATLDDNLRKVPPQNLEAESSVLGGILLDNDAINRALEILTPADFYRESHRKIFSAMIELSERNEPVDLITLSETLTAKGVLEAVGGSAYLVGADIPPYQPANQLEYDQNTTTTNIKITKSKSHAKKRIRVVNKKNELVPYFNDEDDGIELKDYIGHFKDYVIPPFGYPLMSFQTQKKQVSFEGDESEEEIELISP